MEYTNMNGYLIPNLTTGRQPSQKIGKYGSLRREFLRENAPVTFDEMTMSGTLYPHLLEIDRMVREQISNTMESLLKKNPAPNRKSDPLGWTQHMNSLQLEAEELASPMLYAL